MKLLIKVIIKGYQKVVSPWTTASCRFYPTCSQYCIDAVDKYGASRGVLMGLRRLSRCHPFNPGGYDPVK